MNPLGRIRYNSLRSAKARIAVGLDSYIKSILAIMVPVFIAGGIVLVVLNMPIGWLLIGLSAIPAMIVDWEQGELARLRSNKSIQFLDDVLDADVLGRLEKQPTQSQLLDALGKTSGAGFMGTRFGIKTNLLKDIIPENSINFDELWQDSWDIAKAVNSEVVTSSMVMVALIRQVPNYKVFLSNFGIGESDLINGILWHLSLLHMIDKYDSPKKTGGIARDWSFGWTPLLDRLSFNISLYSSGISSFNLQSNLHESSLDQIKSIFSGRGRQNVALVGPSGVGKMYIVESLAASLMNPTKDIPQSLHFNQILKLDASALIAATPEKGQIESLLPQLFHEAYIAKNTILCLDNAQLFFEDGIGSIDVSNTLLSLLRGGQVKVILTMDEQRSLQINQRNPEMNSIINRINVQPSSEQDTIEILQRETPRIDSQHGTVITYQALIEAYRLSERYMYDIEMPGKAVSLLEAAAQYGQGGLITALVVQEAVEKTTDIKVGVATDDNEKDKLLRLEEFIHERMIGQERAVGVVSDALRRARSGIRNQNRPMGAFLFLGPTGVGKTELAKALAEVYFNDESGIVRVNMNEYSNSSDVERLIADASENQYSLTAQIRRQPFSVVLLDEFEKAHPDVINAFMQLLDEGILRDITGRDISFRDAIIIATSNAGADRIREYIERGYNVEQFEDRLIDEITANGSFTPELLNRFDEIVVFKPLAEAELLQIVDLILAGLNKTLAERGISVEVNQDAKEYLVANGNDVRHGARPMRRVVQKAVENIIAKQLLAGQAQPGQLVTITLEQVQEIVQVKQQANEIIG